MIVDSPDWRFGVARSFTILDSLIFSIIILSGAIELICIQHFQFAPGLIVKALCESGRQVSLDYFVMGRLAGGWMDRLSPEGDNGYCNRKGVAPP